MSQPAILHLDLDAFFASVEQRDDPARRGHPVVVGGLGPRGVVAAASYEARRFGVHSAMPMATARRACPHAMFVAPRPERYAEVSAQVMQRLRAVTPLVEPLSLDEAFLDVRGAGRLLGTGPQIAQRLRRTIRTDLGLTASVGVASTKMVAKIASDAAKPDGMLVVPEGTELDFLHPLPVRRLWGVGPATASKLERYGVETVGDLARLPESTVVHALGDATGRHLLALARNEDPRPVVPDRPTKSIGHEETFPTDRADRAGLARDARRMAELVAQRLRDHGWLARTVQLKVRFADFTTITRAQTLADPTDATAAVVAVVDELLGAVDVAPGVRLLGVSVAQLDRAGAVQTVLDLDGAPGRSDPGLDRALDELRARFGEDAVGRAGSMIGGRVRRARRGSLWGPDEEGS